MAAIFWSSGVVLQFDETGKLVLCRKSGTDNDGVELQKKLQADNPTHTVICIAGPVT